jgi:hypothetical protein
MARHLIIGDGTAFGVTAGLVNDGAVSIQKMTQNGPTELVAGDTIADAPQIRIVGGGTDGKNIVTPWIYGKDVVNWSGRSNVAAAAQTSTVLPVTTSSAAAKEIDVKIVRIGASAPEFFKFSVSIVASSVIAVSGAAINNAFNALTNVPDWLNPTSSLSTATVTFTGAKRGDTCQSGNVWEESPAIFEMIISNPETTQTYTIADNVIDAIPGIGDGFAVKAFEESLMGAQYGYYNRIAQPITPTSQAATGESYDMYVLAATKDGSSSSQINGVDNLIELNMALKAGDADSAVVENKLNSYLASANFAPVIL